MDIYPCLENRPSQTGGERKVPHFTTVSSLVMSSVSLELAADVLCSLCCEVVEAQDRVDVGAGYGSYFSFSVRVQIKSSGMYRHHRHGD